MAFWVITQLAEVHIHKPFEIFSRSLLRDHRGGAAIALRLAAKGSAVAVAPYSKAKRVSVAMNATAVAV